MSDRDDSTPDAPPPADESPGDATSASEGELEASDAAPADAAPTEKAPTEKAPTDAAPTEGAPAGQEPAEKVADAKPPAAPPASDTPAAAPPAAAGTPPQDEPAAEDEAAKKAAAAAKAKAKAEAAAKAKAAKEAAEAAKPPWERDPVVPEWREAGDDPLAAALAAAHPGGLLQARTFAGDLVLELAPGSLRAVAEQLHGEHGYTLLVDLCGAHYPDREEAPFEVVYHLYSFDANRRVRLKVAAGAEPEVPSVVEIWEGANWPEREAWDMYGIRFTGHPDMTRILMWEGFNGFPLRKEFPVEGVDTGAAIYPEYYEQEAGPVTGTGTGWKPAPPPEPEPEPEAATEEEGGADGAS